MRTEDNGNTRFRGVYSSFYLCLILLSTIIVFYQIPYLYTGLSPLLVWKLHKDKVSVSLVFCLQNLAYDLAFDMVYRK